MHMYVCIHISLPTYFHAQTRRGPRSALGCFSKPDLEIAEIKHRMVHSHEHIPQYPAPLSFISYKHLKPNKKQQHEKQPTKNKWEDESRHQRGPRGGGMSKATKPLMHCAADPSPILRMYWTVVSRLRSLVLEMEEFKNVKWKLFLQIV